LRGRRLLSWTGGTGHYPFVTRRLQTKDQPISGANNRREIEKYDLPFSILLQQTFDENPHRAGMLARDFV